MKKNYKRYWKNFIEIIKRPDMSVLPAQLAFFFILSLVPTFTIIVYVASFMSISLSDITEYLNLNIDPAILNMLTPVIEDFTFKPEMILLLIVGIYIASNGTNSVIVSANNIYGIDQKPFVYRRVKSIIMVFILILLFLFILLVPVFGNFLLDLIAKYTGYNEIYNVLNIIKTPFSWLVIFLFIKTLYTIAPDKEIPSSSVNKGAIFTSFGIILSTQLYLSYVKNIADYSILYSGLSNLAVIMIWIYIVATIFVIGMGLNYKEELYSLEQTKEMK